MKRLWWCIGPVALVFGAGCSTGSDEPADATPPATVVEAGPTTESATGSTTPTAPSVPVAPTDTFGAPQPAGTGDAEVVALVFDWKAPCTVPVTEQVERADVATVVKYDVTVTPRGDQFVVSIGNVTPTTRNGRTVNVEEFDSVKAGFLVPDLIVGADGVAREVERLAETVDQVVAFSDAELTAAELERLRGEAGALLEQTVITKYWDVWTGFWAQLGGAPLGDSTYRNGRLKADRHGDTPLVNLSFTESLEGPEYISQLESLLGAPGQISAARSVTRIESVIEPSTLRPAETRFQQDVTITANQSTETQREKRTAVFDWLSATCGPLEGQTQAPLG